MEGVEENLLQQDKKARRKLSKGQWGCVVFLVLIVAGISIAYTLIVEKIKQGVIDASEVCKSSDPGNHRYKHPSSQEVNNYFFNVTNPGEVINGEQAILHEIGPFAYKFKNHRGNIEYDQSEDTVSSYDWSLITPNAHRSCDNCDPDKELWMYNPGYGNIVALALNEANLMLNFACSTEQINQIYNESAPYCEVAQQGGAEPCRCCAYIPNTVNATQCSDLASTQSRSGGILSLMAKYDHGYKISDEQNPIFAAADGVYTIFIKKGTPSQYLTGYPSAYVGFISTQRRLKSEGITSSIVQENAALTADLRTVCYPLYCPSISEVAAGFSAAEFNLAYMQNVSCNGLVPGTDELMEKLNMTQDEANQYRYLEGVQCDSFAPAVIIGGIVEATALFGSSIVCANASDVAPCCPASFSAVTFTGAAMGCVQFISGMYTERRVFSTEEAMEVLGDDSLYVHKTGCAKDEEKFEMVKSSGETNFTLWFVPSTYEYGVTPMSWADPSVYQTYENAPFLGEVVIGNVTGKQFTFREGRGVTSNFLEYQLTDGKPRRNTDELWIPYKRGPVLTRKTKSRRVEGIDVNDFYPDLQADFSDDAEMEDRQRKGQNPWPNVHNLVYNLDGRPIITSQPNFYLTDTPEALSQMNNTDRKAPPGGGVSLYRTLSTYPNGKPLPVPELITTDTWEQFGKAYYEGYQSIEPATGATIAGQISNMASFFSWNCDPAMANSRCNLITMEDDGSMCYADSNGYMYPCNAGNVFIPKVQGGKVLPVWWIYASPDANDAYDTLRYVMDTRLALSVLILVLPILCVSAIAGVFWYALKYVGKQSDELLVDDATVF